MKIIACQIDVFSALRGQIRQQLFVVLHLLIRTICCVDESNEDANWNEYPIEYLNIALNLNRNEINRKSGENTHRYPKRPDLR